MPQPRSTTRSGSLGGRRAQPPAAPSRRRRPAARPRRNSSTWRYFACRRGLTRPSASEMPSATQHRVVLRAAAAAWRGRARAGLGRPARARCGVHHRLAASWSPAAGASRSRSRRASCRTARPAARRRSPGGVLAWLAVCAWVSSYAVTCRRRPALRSTYRSSTRRHRGGRRPRRGRRPGPDQGSLVEQDRRTAERGQGAGRARPSLSRAARTTIEDQPTQRPGDDQAAVAGVHAGECIQGPAAVRPRQLVGRLRAGAADPATEREPRRAQPAEERRRRAGCRAATSAPPPISVQRAPKVAPTQPTTGAPIGVPPMKIIM